ncbi:MAG: hypothetical protein EHM45_20620, partial [Desulfobacteraceae bacterium]
MLGIRRKVFWAAGAGFKLALYKIIFDRMVMEEHMKKSGLFFLGFLFLATGFLHAQASTKAATRPAVNTDGTVIQVPVTVNKVAALHGFSYEKIVLLGAEDKIVVCGDYHHNLWPWALKVFPRIKEVPAMPKPWEPNMEQMLKIQPDVIFTFSDPAPLNKMKELGFAVVYPDEKSALTLEANCKGMLRVYAEALGGAAVERAKKYNEYFDRKLAMVTAVTNSIPMDKRPKVYFAIRKPLQTAGKNSYIPELVEKAGGLCVTRDLPLTYGKDIGIEQMLALNPEYIFLDHLGARYLGSAQPAEILAGMLDDARLKSVAALQKNQVFFAPIGVFFWDTGEQLPLELMWMAKTLHPDKFKNLDLRKELAEFYRTFFNYELTPDEIERILRNDLPEGM